MMKDDKERIALHHTGQHWLVHSYVRAGEIGAVSMCAPSSVAAAGGG